MVHCVQYSDRRKTTMNKCYENLPMLLRKLKLLMLAAPARSCSSSRCIHGVHSSRWGPPPSPDLNLASFSPASMRSRRSLPNLRGSRMSVTEKAVTREVWQATGGDLVALVVFDCKLLIGARCGKCFESVLARSSCPSDGDLTTLTESATSPQPATSSPRSVDASKAVPDPRSRSGCSSSAPDWTGTSSRRPGEVLRGDDLFDVVGLCSWWADSTLIACRCCPAPECGVRPSHLRRQVAISRTVRHSTISSSLSMRWFSAVSEFWLPLSSIAPTLVSTIAVYTLTRKPIGTQQMIAKALRHAFNGVAGRRVQPTRRRCQSRTVIGRLVSGTCYPSMQSLQLPYDVISALLRRR